MSESTRVRARVRPRGVDGGVIETPTLLAEAAVSVRHAALNNLVAGRVLERQP
jgi:hypothetical protein